MPRAPRDARLPGVAGHIAASGAVLLTLLLLGVAPAAGQTLSVGPRVGVNAAGVVYRDLNAFGNTLPRFGGHVGVAVVLQPRRVLEFEGALLYRQGGYLGQGAYTFDLKTDDLVLPIGLRLRLPTAVSPHLSAGVAARFQLRCRLTDVSLVGETTCDDPVVGTDWRAVELMGRGGLGVSFPVQGGRLLLDLLLGVGIGDVKESALPPGWARSISIQLSAAYLVPLRRS